MDAHCPRMAYKSVPTANRLVTQKEVGRVLEIHTRRLASIRQRKKHVSIDDSMPDVMKLRHMSRNMKRLQQQYDRQQEIRRHNHILFHKMASIMRGSGTIDHGKPDLELLPEKPQKSLTLEFRKAEVQRIDLRNKELLHRLKTTTPYYNVAKWESDFEHQKKFQKLMSHFPRDRTSSQAAAAPGHGSTSKSLGPTGKATRTASSASGERSSEGAGARPGDGARSGTAPGRTTARGDDYATAAGGGGSAAGSGDAGAEGASAARAATVARHDRAAFDGGDGGLASTRGTDALGDERRSRRGRRKKRASRVGKTGSTSTLEGRPVPLRATDMLAGFDARNHEQSKLAVLRLLKPVAVTHGAQRGTYAQSATEPLEGSARSPGPSRAGQLPPQRLAELTELYGPSGALVAPMSPAFTGSSRLLLAPSPTLIDPRARSPSPGDATSRSPTRGAAETGGEHDSAPGAASAGDDSVRLPAPVVPAADEGTAPRRDAPAMSESEAYTTDDGYSDGFDSEVTGSSRPASRKAGDFVNDGPASSRGQRRPRPAPTVDEAGEA